MTVDGSVDATANVTPSKGGAPKGNRNALKNGSKLRVAVGQLPGKLARLARQARDYRELLEQAVEERHGGINAEQAHEIGLAAEAVLHQSICRWLLRQRLDLMTTADVLACSTSLLKAGETRNKAIARLKLAPPTQDELMRQWYSQPWPAAEPPASPPVAAAAERGEPGPTPGATSSADALDAAVGDGPKDHGASAPGEED
jgi:hypothetical protein